MCFYCRFDINLTPFASLFTCSLLKGEMKNKLDNNLRQANSFTRSKRFRVCYF